MGEIQDGGGENSIPEEDLIGMNCRAPYSKIVDRAVVYHDAIILDFVDTSVPLEQLKVRSLVVVALDRIYSNSGDGLRAMLVRGRDGDKGVIGNSGGTDNGSEVKFPPTH